MSINVRAAAQDMDNEDLAAAYAATKERANALYAAAKQFEAELFNRLQEREATQLPAGDWLIEIKTGLKRYEYDIDRLHDRLLPLLGPHEWEWLVRAVTTYKVDTVRLNAMKRKRGPAFAAIVEAATTTTEAAPRVVVTKREGS